MGRDPLLVTLVMYCLVIPLPDISPKLYQFLAIRDYIIKTRAPVIMCIIVGPRWFWTNRQNWYSLAEMSGRLCCCKQQNSKLLAQFVVTDPLRPHEDVCTIVWLPLSITGWSFVPSCRDMQLKALSNMGKFSNIACSIISCLVVGLLITKKNSIVTKLCHVALGLCPTVYSEVPITAYVHLT